MSIRLSLNQSSKKQLDSLFSQYSKLDLDFQLEQDREWSLLVRKMVVSLTSINYTEAEDGKQPNVL